VTAIQLFGLVWGLFAAGTFVVILRFSLGVAWSHFRHDDTGGTSHTAAI